MQIENLIFATILFIVTSGNVINNSVSDNTRVDNYDDKKINIAYDIQYGIDSQTTGDVKSLKEQRNGDIVKGQYSVNDPDGYTRVVNYTVDKENGFQATVTRFKGTHEFVTREKAKHRSQQYHKHTNSPKFLREQSHATSMRQVLKRHPNQPNINQYPKNTYDPMEMHKMNQIYPSITTTYPTSIIQEVTESPDITPENLSLLEISTDNLVNLYKLGVLRAKNPDDAYVTESSLYHDYSKGANYENNLPNKHRKRHSVYLKRHKPASVIHSYKLIP